MFGAASIGATGGRAARRYKVQGEPKSDPGQQARANAVAADRFRDVGDSDPGVMQATSSILDNAELAEGTLMAFFRLRRIS